MSPVRRISTIASRWARSRLTRTVLGVTVLLAVLTWGLPAFASYEAVWASLTSLDGALLPLLIALGVINLVAPALPHRAALPGLGTVDTLLIDLATSGVTNAVPGGTALATGMTWSMYRTIGFSRTAIVRCMVVTSIWHTFVKLGSPLLALAWLSTERPVTAGLIQATALGTALFAAVVVLGVVVLGKQEMAGRLGVLLNRVPGIGVGWVERLEQLRDDSRWLLRHRWRRLTAWTLGGHAAYFALMVTCLRSVGISDDQLSPAAIVAGVAFGRLVTVLPLTPGGIGVMELGLTGVLVGVGSADEGAVVAAVLLFRFITFALPIPLGAIAWVLWNCRRGHSSVPLEAEPPDLDEGGGGGGAAAALGRHGAAG